MWFQVSMDYRQDGFHTRNFKYQVVIEKYSFEFIFKALIYIIIGGGGYKSAAHLGPFSERL